MTVSELEELFAWQVQVAGLPKPERQFRLVPSRRFRWDFAWPGERLLVEVDGGTWVYGRHNRPAGIESDAEKQSLAAALGFRTMRVTRNMIDTGRALELLEVALGQRHRGAAVKGGGDAA